MSREMEPQQNLNITESCEPEEQPAVPPNQNTDADESNHPGAEPRKEQCDIPTNDESYEQMVDRFATVGLQRWDVDKTIEAKTTAYNKACREYKLLMNMYKKEVENNKKQNQKLPRAARKNSIQKLN